MSKRLRSSSPVAERPRESKRNILDRLPSALRDVVAESDEYDPTRQATSRAWSEAATRPCARKTRDGAACLDTVPALTLTRSCSAYCLRGKECGRWMVNLLESLASAAGLAPVSTEKEATKAGTTWPYETVTVRVARDVYARERGWPPATASGLDVHLHARDGKWLVRYHSNSPSTSTPAAEHWRVVGLIGSRRLESEGYWGQWWEVPSAQRAADLLCRHAQESRATYLKIMLEGPRATDPGVGQEPVALRLAGASKEAPTLAWRAGNFQNWEPDPNDKTRALYAEVELATAQHQRCGQLTFNGRHCLSTMRSGAACVNYCARNWERCESWVSDFMESLEGLSLVLPGEDETPELVETVAVVLFNARQRPILRMTHKIGETDDDDVPQWQMKVSEAPARFFKRAQCRVQVDLETRAPYHSWAPLVEVLDCDEVPLKNHAVNLTPEVGRRLVCDVLGHEAPPAMGLRLTVGGGDRLPSTGALKPHFPDAQWMDELPWRLEGESQLWTEFSIAAVRP